VAEAVGDVEAPVPVGARVGLSVHLGEHHRRVDVAVLVGDPQVELDVGPVVRKRVEDLLEVVGEGHEAEGAEEGGEPAATEPGGGEGDAAAGKAVFTANCGSCHTLEEAGTSGTIGPNLDDSTLGLDGVVQQVENGGGVMPAFAGELSEEEIANVAAFVVASQG